MSNKITKWAIILGGAVITLVIGVRLIRQYYLEPLLAKTLKSAVAESSDGIYQINFDRLQYAPLTGNAVLTKIKLTLDTALYQQQIHKQSTSHFTYKGTIPEVILRDIKLLKLVFSRKLEIDLIKISQPTVEIIQQKPAPLTTRTKPSPYRVISKFVKSFRVKKIDFEDIKFTFSDKTKPHPQRIVLEKLNVNITDFLIDSLSHQDSTRFYYSKNTALQLSNLSIPSIGALHDFRLDSISFSSQKRRISVKGIHYTPRFKGRAFTTRADGNDRIGFVFHDIEVTQVNLDALVFEKKLIADQAIIKRGNIDIFGDGTYPARGSKVGKYPQQQFRRLPFKMKLDTVQVENFLISYSEFNPDTEASGGVNFNLTHGKLYNLTNDTLALLQNPICEAHIQSEFMGVAPLNTLFKFNIASPRGTFSCDGELGEIDLKRLNPVTQPLALTKIESGVVRSFKFSMKGDEYGVKGQGTLLYNDLKTSILKIDEEGNLSKRKLITGIADVIFIQDNNPSPNSPIRSGAIDYTRDPKKSYFATLWRSLRQAMAKCVLKRKGLKKIKNLNARVAGK